MTDNTFYSKRTQAYLKANSTEQKLINTLKSLLWLCVPVLLVAGIVLDFAGVFKVSNLF